MRSALKLPFAAFSIAKLGDLVQSKSVECDGKSSKRGVLDPLRVRGNYENRIKFLSTPEKVFEYFAQDMDPDSSEARMKLEDLLNAVIPFNFWYVPPYVPEDEDDEEDGEKKEGEEEEGASELEYAEVKIRAATAVMRGALGTNFPSFFEICDADKDGFISFEEFLLFTTLLTTPLDLFQIGFALLGSPCNDIAGKPTAPTASSAHFEKAVAYAPDLAVSRDEFARLMTAMFARNPRISKARAVNSAIDPRGIKNSSTGYEHIAKVLGAPVKVPGSDVLAAPPAGSPTGLSRALFGDDGLLHWSAFKRLLVAARVEMLAAELLAHLDASPADAVVYALAGVEKPQTEAPETDAEKQEDAQEKKEAAVEVANFIRKVPTKTKPAGERAELLLPPLLVARAFVSWVPLAQMEGYAHHVDKLAAEGKLEGVGNVPFSEVASLLLATSEDSRLRDVVQLVAGRSGEITPVQLAQVLRTIEVTPRGFSLNSTRAMDPTVAKQGFPSEMAADSYQELVKVLYLVFDRDQSGTLSDDEFFGHAQRKREQLNRNEDPTFVRQMRRVSACFDRHIQGKPVPVDGQHNQQ